MSVAGVIAAALRNDAPYAAEIQMGAQLILGFQGARTGGRPYYWYRGTRYSTPDKIPGLTVSRASGAYWPKADGSLVWFPPNTARVTDRGIASEPAGTNLLTQTEAFDHANWTKTRGAITPNAGLAPNRTMTADLFVEDTTASSDHGMTFNGSYGFGAGTYAESIYLKPFGNNFAYLWLDTGSGLGHTVEINLLTGATRVTRQDVTGNWSVPTVDATPSIDGWWRLSIVASTPQGIVQMRIYTSPTAWTAGNYGTPQYTGTGVNGVYVWGADIKADTQVTSYVPATTAAATRYADDITIANQAVILGQFKTNLLLQSQALGTSPWGMAGTSTVSDNAGVDPDGTTTATLISPTSSFGGRVQTLNVAGSRTYTAAISEKWVSGNTALNFTVFDVTNSTVLNSQTINVTSAWQRFSATFTTASNTTQVYILVRDTNASGFGSFLAWGVHVNPGSVAEDYIPTTTAPVSVGNPVVVAIDGYLPAGDGVGRTLVSVRNSANTSGDRVEIQRDASNNLQVNATAMGVSQTSILVGGKTGARAIEAAVRIRPASNAAAVDAGALQSVAATPPSGLNEIILGRSAINNRHLSGEIRTVIVYGDLSDVPVQRQAA
jgi:hypothetical protein